MAHEEIGGRVARNKQLGEDARKMNEKLEREDQIGHLDDDDD
jgi:hypothetical protein